MVNRTGVAADADVPVAGARSAGSGLTDMSVVEICGLQWMYFNITSSAKWADGELIPPNTIAVRNQHYRGEFSPVTGSRRRFIRVPEGIFALATESRKNRKQPVYPQDFGLAAPQRLPGQSGKHCDAAPEIDR